MSHTVIPQILKYIETGLPSLTVYQSLSGIMKQLLSGPWIILHFLLGLNMRFQILPNT